MIFLCQVCGYLHVASWIQTKLRTLVIALSVVFLCMCKWPGYYLMFAAHSRALIHVCAHIHVFCTHTHTHTHPEQ